VFPNWDYEEQEVRLNAGDSILMYTDGITETRNTADEEFGEERLIDLIRLFRDKDAAALTRETISAASSFSNGKFEDDLTVVAVSVN
jgi:sigma-B regulation protein RsbU (phosphoserine phosphatase)